MMFSFPNIHELIIAIEQARWHDDSKLPNLIQQAIDRGVYPKETLTKLTHLEMVKGWGANWFQWTGVLECPDCKSDLRDHKKGPPFKREFAVIVSDRVSEYQCPDCGHGFHRIEGR